MHFGNEVEGSEYIGNVVQTSHLCLQLVDVLWWLITTCTQTQLSRKAVWAANGA